MNLIRQHPYLILFGSLSLLALFVGYELLSTIEDVKLLADINNGKVSVPPLPGSRGRTKPNKYTVAFLKGFVLPTSMDSEISGKLGSAWEKGVKLLPQKGKADNLLAQVASHSILADALAEHLSRNLASMPVCASLPTVLDTGASVANFREVRNSARFWVLLAQNRAWAGEREKAWVLACGPVLLAQYMEAEESTCAGIPLITRMIGVATRKIGTQALLELASYLAVDRRMAEKTVSLMNKLDLVMVPVMEIINQDARLLPTFAATIDHAIKHGSGLKRFSQRPSLLTSTITNPTTTTKYLDPLYEPLRKVAGKPWATVKPVAESFTRKLGDLALKLASPGKEWGGYILHPTTLLLDYLISMSTPNVTKAMEQDYTARQSMRGIAAAFGILAFQREQKRWPSQLAEVEKWLSVSFLEDVMTGKPMEYSVSETEGATLMSPGPDLVSGTRDDLVFLPLPAADTAEIEP